MLLLRLWRRRRSGSGGRSRRSDGSRGGLLLLLLQLWVLLMLLLLLLRGRERLHERGPRPDLRDGRARDGRPLVPSPIPADAAGQHRHLRLERLVVGREAADEARGHQEAAVGVSREARGGDPHGRADPLVVGGVALLFFMF